METIVKIKWDEPSDKNWLCPDNIKIALSAYCPNTNFEVGEVDSNLLDPQVKSVCGYCKDCKFWNQENLECENDIIWLNKDKNVSFNISDLKTNKFFGCVRFEQKKKGA